MSTIIQLIDYDNDDGYELIIPDMCTYFKVRYPDKNGERVKGNLLIGMEYFSENNVSTEYRNTFCASCSHGSDTICKIEFTFKDNHAYCKLLNIPKGMIKKYKKKLFSFLNIIVLYLIEIVKVTSIFFQKNKYSHYFFVKNNLATISDDYLCVTQTHVVDFLVKQVTAPIFYSKMYSHKESIGLCGRLKQIAIPLHKK